MIQQQTHQEVALHQKMHELMSVHHCVVDNSPFRRVVAVLSSVPQISDSRKNFNPAKNIADIIMQKHSFVSLTFLDLASDRQIPAIWHGAGAYHGVFPPLET